MPCDPGGDTGGQTVWDQQKRFFESQGNGISPRTLFCEQLVNQLLEWKANGEDILLFGDFNDNVYTGRLAKRLSEDDLRIKELCRDTTGQKLPPTFLRGQRPIDA